MSSGKADALQGKPGITSSTLALNQSGRPQLLHTDKTFFRTSYDLPLPVDAGAGNGKGEFTFEVVVPEEEEEFIDVLGNGWGKGELPPSLYLGRRNFEGGVIGFSQWIVWYSSSESYEG
jgi:hypothetical protein